MHELLRQLLYGKTNILGMSRFIITSLLLWCTYVDSDAQIDLSTLNQKFESYQSVWGKTEIHLVLNQDKFFPGDTVWFKAYFLKEDRTSVTGKQLIDINLVDVEGKSKLHLLISVIDGSGQNQLVIPNALTAGFYLITAHSSWMMNFNPMPIFKKTIQVVTGNRIIEKEKTSIRSSAEGGHLIRGIPNKVSIMTNRVNVPVQIIDSATKEEGRTITDNNGLASIVFVPDEGINYFVKIEGDTTRTALSSVEEGYRITLAQVNKKEDSVRVLIIPSPGASVQKELYFIVSAKGKIHYSTAIKPLANEHTELSLSREKLPTGFVHLFLITGEGNTIASRDLYIPQENTIEAKLQTSKNQYHTREKVQLEVTLSDSDGRPVEGEFSIRVLNAALFDTEKKNSLDNNRRIVNGEGVSFFHVDQADTSWMNSLDNYLICNTTHLPWKEILKGNYTQPLFPFTTAIQKNGFAYLGDTHEPVPDLTQVMFYLQKNVLHYQVVTQEKGKISFAIPDIYGQDELFYLAEAKGQKIPIVKMEWNDVSIPLPHAPASTETKNADVYAASSIKRNLIDQSYTIYTSGQPLPSVAHPISFEDEIDGADITIKVQDYITFSSMEELIREISSSLYYRKKGMSGSVRIKLIPPLVATDDPLYIIDGVPTKDTDFFLSLKPSDVLILKIVKTPGKLSPLGFMGKNGILLVQTKQGNIRKPAEDSMVIEGLNKAVNFSNHNYSGGAYSQKPDFRSTLYWNSSIKTDSGGKATLQFYTSDDIGKMNIGIHGLTKDGQPFSEFKNIEVSLETKRN